MNVHSYGGYFMWPPGAYIFAGWVPLRRPILGEENYLWAAPARSCRPCNPGAARRSGRAGPAPVIDVLYSAAGNSADEHWYNRGIFGWDFEVGVDLWDSQERDRGAVGFQPPFPEGFDEAMEFASGLTGLLEVTRANGNDVTPPKTTLVITDGGVTFNATEPVTIHYTLDGSRPTYTSPMASSAGLREGAAPITLQPGNHHRAVVLG